MRWTRLLPPALTTDLPVLGLLVVCWLLIPVAWAHVTAGIALTGGITMHLLTRRERVVGVFRHGRVRSPTDARRRVGDWLLLVSAAGMVGTGLLRWTGMTPQQVRHGGVSYALVAFVVLHLWWIRKSLRARLRAHAVPEEITRRERRPPT